MPDSKPWPQVPVGNVDHTQAAVVIVGSGFSGMCMAIDLLKRNKCQNFVILEKASGVGGTWLDNKYPGCCCDIWSLLYSYSFEQNPDWTRLYPGQEEILGYLQGVAQKYGLYKHIRFNSTVEEARWDEAEKKWKTSVRVSGDKDAEFSEGYTISSDFLVSAVGQLNVPQYPRIPGLDDFKGKKMHSARWDWSYGLEGKRIAVIGNGASAVQIIPEIAKVASKVTVYQRQANWVVPRLDKPVSPLMRLAYRYVPPLRWRTRASMMDYRESFYSAVFDRESAFAEQLRQWCLGSMRQHFPGQPEMWQKLTPNYSPGCKRVIISDDYYPALARDNVSLVTEPISHMTETGIAVEGGDDEEFDLIVLATGFRSVEFMHPIKITGAQGQPLSEVWKQGACAYLGVVVESLPNFGIFYGPNTNLGHNSIVLMIEAQSRYLNAMVAKVLEARKQGKQLAMLPKPEVVRRFNAELQQELEKSSFADPNCQSWYKNDEGKITNNWSQTVVDYQHKLETVHWDEFVLEGSGADVVNQRDTKVGRVVEETRVSNTTIALSALSMLAVAGGFLARGNMRLRMR
ncbi:cyclohexanone monooxygenase [Diplodia corticola]|uniref:Cyclohexanone monooxygenase n=1 Tax=Diplodia corticola TaxID=236234 RepID=A0A1J9S999_9PEZI|nr:cyclohexanone monooxygenase [Diplodia corticola]OJD36157.1 cyclohexanone monooxygenase [Diplodia corticola]